MILPANLSYGQDAFFDVTAFIRATKAPFYAFNLRTTGTDVFSSLEYNYGHPAQLKVSFDVPEPASAFLTLAGLAMLGAARKRKTMANPRM
jgi:hypothetical protein